MDKEDKYKRGNTPPGKKTAMYYLWQELDPTSSYTEDEIRSIIDNLAKDKKYPEEIRDGFNKNLKSNFKGYGVENGYFIKVEVTLLPNSPSIDASELQSILSGIVVEIAEVNQKRIQLENQRQEINDSFEQKLEKLNVEIETTKQEKDSQIKKIEEEKRQLENKLMQLKQKLDTQVFFDTDYSEAA